MYRLSKKREAQLLRQLNYQIKEGSGWRSWGHWQVQIKTDGNVSTVRVSYSDDLFLSDIVLEGHTTHLTPQYILRLIKLHPRT